MASGDGVYTQLDGGMNGLDSLVYEVKDSLLQGKFTRFAKTEEGDYFVRTIQYFDRNKPIGTKETYTTNRKIFIQEQYFDNPDSILFNRFYPNGQVKESGINYIYEKSGIWKYYSESGELQEEIGYQGGYYNGKYKEYHSNGIAKTEGNFVVIIQEREVTTFDPDTFEEKKAIQEREIPVKNGKWIYRNKGGDIEKTEWFDDGKLKKKTNKNK